MDKYLSDVIKKSLEVYKESDGVFDITVYPLVRAWGFGNKQIKALPDSAATKAIMPFIGSNKLLIIHNRLIKRIPGVQIDVDGIAQGYSVDVLADYFDKKGVKNYMIEVGGELRVKGKKQPENVMMRVGIEGPAKNAEDEPFLQRIIEMGDGGVTTSGNYRKYLKSGNKILSHLINPNTGYPLQNKMIAAKDAITADGYDNPLMGMGLKKALLFLQ
ncbi:MAG: Thiamine biosynthesis lipoprotein ApbE [Mucilaginibacter sp.]|nr:Thiamine biosynthesis lipoprotein ApbE [Mucilaginibacter sp.]